MTACSPKTLHFNGSGSGILTDWLTYVGLPDNDTDESVWGFDLVFSFLRGALMTST